MMEIYNSTNLVNFCVDNNKLNELIKILNNKWHLKGYKSYIHKTKVMKNYNSIEEQLIDGLLFEVAFVQQLAKHFMFTVLEENE